MKLRAQLVAWARKQLAEPGAHVVTGHGNWWPRVLESFTGAWQRNVEVRRDLVLSYFAVYACLTRISGDIGKLRPMFMELDADGIPQEVEVPAYSPVLRKPNRYQTWQKFVEFWIACKLIHGNAYVLLVRDQRRVVIAMHVLDPQRVRALVAGDGAVYYALNQDDLANINESSMVVPASEIIHDPMITLFHPLMGVSPIFACGLAATQGLAIQNNSAMFFQNMSRPSGILMAPTEVDDETIDKLRRQWEENYAAHNIGKIAVLGDGLKYQALGMTAEDAQLIEQLRFTAEQVCTTFHVPGYMVGVGPAPSFNNIGALNQQYYSQCLQVLIESLEAHLNQGLGLDGRKRFVELDLDDLIRMDGATQVDILVKEVAGTIRKPNEARRKRRLGPVTGGDTLYMQQQNYSLAALDARDRLPNPFAPTQAAPPADPPALDDEEDNDDEAADAAIITPDDKAAAAFLKQIKEFRIELGVEDAFV